MYKKYLSLALLGVGIFGCPGHGKANVADEKLFLEPHLAHLAGKAVYQAGKDLQQQQRNTCEYAISVNCGVNLAATTHVVSKNERKVAGLGAHMQEIADSLKENGSAIVTAPASYGVVFTSGAGSKEEVEKKIASALSKINANDEPAKIAAALNELKEVTRATFVKRGGKLQLVRDEKMLTLGEKVWRKNPDGARLENFHSEEEYLVAIREAGLFCEEIKRPCFFGQVKWDAYNKSLQAGESALGQAYKDNHPFTIYKVVKKAA